MPTRIGLLKNPDSAIADVQHDRHLLFHSYLSGHLDQMKASRKAIYESPLVADENSYTLPIECDDVIEHLESIDQSMSKILDVIKEVHERQLRVLPNHYKLLMFLYVANDDVHSALKSVEQFRPICTSRTVKAIKGQVKVQDELWSVIQSCESIEFEAGCMLKSLFPSS